MKNNCSQFLGTVLKSLHYIEIITFFIMRWNAVITCIYNIIREVNAFDGSVFFRQRKPLEDYYRKQKKLLEFQVGSAPGESWQGLLAALHLPHFNAGYSPCKLTTGLDGL